MWVEVTVPYVDRILENAGLFPPVNLDPGDAQVSLPGRTIAEVLES